MARGDQVGWMGWWGWAAGREALSRPEALFNAQSAMPAIWRVRREGGREGEGEGEGGRERERERENAMPCAATPRFAARRHSQELPARMG